ncbi:hypothetical protein PCANC_20617 [Puccinia coronata f. sp. avenae]|uniref:Uncharacterized protein n=1 Tax=Puccinia coronata f. sp. avenae TaxID=200324 RepID=A0A2N5UDC2_9BASI|nr:hypothetical protein PCANC_20617 [Puccinia coronata f. sp. avenae]PLW35701.1 hypothetical protein PCASD_13126 [Puccinia coronata f. sp. avenae]
MSIISRHQPKGQTYARFLDSVRCAGLWSQSTPITAKGLLITSAISPAEVGPSLSWQEIIRKYLKHNPDRALTAEIATTELALRLLLASADHDQAYDHDKAHLNDEPESGQSLLPPLVRSQDKEAVQQHVIKLTASLAKYNTNEADPKLLNEQNAANIIISFGYYTVGDYEQCLQTLQKCTFVVPETVDLNFDKYDIILLVLGLTVKALAQERKGADPSATLEAYRRVMEVFDLCVVSLSLGTMDELHNELHGWAELAMYRACVLSRLLTPGMPSLEVHRCYSSRARYWPLSFRLNKRGVVYKSYIRLMFITARSDSWTSSSRQPIHEYSEVSISTLQDGELITIRSRGEAWRSELVTIAKSYNVILRMTTTFPKAGHSNDLVLEFCDLLYEGWQLGGSDSEGTSQIIDMLHDATRKTFHSQKILRYLVQLLDVKNDWEEAEAALNLYCQLHMTASANENSDSSELDNPRPLVSGEAQLNGGADVAKKDGGGASSAVPNKDTDEDFISTMIYGSRMLIKFLNNPEKATELLDRAHQVMKTTKVDAIRENPSLKSRLARMRGIAAGECAQKADQDTRPALHASYLQFLTEAVESDPASFENMYHMAYAQAELRDVDSALVSARIAVEINPNHTCAWHLLCLLTSASKEFKLALDIAEVGLVNTEDLDEGESGMRTPRMGSSSLSQNSSLPGALLTDETPESTSGTPPTRNTKPALGLIAEPETKEQNEAGEGHLTVPTTSAHPSRDTSVTPTASHFSQTKLEFPGAKSDRLEASIQLRMTKNMLIESLQGPEVALSDQQNLFAFFAQVYSQIHAQDLTQMSRSQSNSNAHSQSQSLSSSQPQSHSKSTSASPSLLHDRNASSTTSPSTTRSPIRGSRLKVRKPTFDLKVSNSIRRRTHMSASSTQLQKQRSTSGANDLAALTQEMADVVVKEDEKKENIANLRSLKILHDLWLMSAATFRRWGKSTECKGAIQEAETLTGESAELWVQYGLYSLSVSELDQAIDSLTKALAFSDNHIPAVVHMARILKEQGSVELAEGLLDVLTQTVAWDIPEAWYLLAEICLATDRLKRGQECLLFSLSLEETKPLRPLRLCLPSCL